MSRMNGMPLKKACAWLDRLPVKYAALAALGLSTGARISEILALRRKDLIGADGTLKRDLAMIRLKRGGGRRCRDVKLYSVYAPYVMRHLDAESRRGWFWADDWVFRGVQGARLTRSAAWAFFRATLGSGYGTHWMRKTHARAYYESLLADDPGDPGRALVVTGEDLGHTRVENTVKYLGFDRDHADRVRESTFDNKELFQ